MLKNTGRPGQPLTIMIFGGTGDLMRRKLLPALYHLVADKGLPDSCTILSIGRKPKTQEGYRDEARQAVADFSRTGVDEAHMARFLSHLHYRQMEFVDQPDSYQGLSQWLDEWEKSYGGDAVRLFFLAVAPEHFGPIVQSLNRHRLVIKSEQRHRVMVEKPFGSDLATARALNRIIARALDESQVYRIDHYLGKEMIRNILAIRFGNSCLSRCGTTTTSITSRSPPPRRWGWQDAADTMSGRHPQRHAAEPPAADAGPDHHGAAGGPPAGIGADEK